MSEYTGTSPHDTYMGDLVHRAKYGNAPIGEREDAAEEIAERMMAFINDAYRGVSLPFSAVVTAPSHNAKPLELAIYLCARLVRAFDLEDWTILLHNSSPIDSVKTLNGAENRYRAVRRSITMTRTGVKRTNGGLLFVDDVFETGATARAVCDAIRAHYPQQEFHVLTATRRPVGDRGRR